MTNETGITKNTIITELARSPHGKLVEYLSVGKQAAVAEPEFLAHLISWNHAKGQIRDSKVALPVIALAGAKLLDKAFVSSALAHLALLSPRDLERAYRFSLEIRVPGHMSAIKGLISRYLRSREQNWSKWTRTAVQHRKTLKALYALTHTKPAPMAASILFDGVCPRGSIFESIRELKNMSASEAAGTILERKIPYLIAMGALGVKAKEPELVLALINRMTPTELTTNMKMLSKLGVKTNPALRSALEEALGKASISKQSTLKTTQAAIALEEEEGVDNNALVAKLQALQEKQLKTISGIDGDWLILADKSGSMQHAIEASRYISATLSKLVRGRVHLVFFDNVPRGFDATGMDYSKLLEATKHVTAGGGTSIGCGLVLIGDKGISVDGIAIVSDGAENNGPLFAPTYLNYSKRVDKRVPVYFYRLAGSDSPEYTDVFLNRCRDAEIDPQVFDLRGGSLDYYSLPNLVKTMRVNRYSLIEEIMDSPLLRVEDILPLRQAVTV